MTHTRSRTCSLAVLAGVLLLTAGCSDSQQISGSGSTTPASTVDSGSTTTSSVAEGTTTTAAPETTLAPTTVPVTAPPATPAPTAAPPPPPSGLTALGAPTNLQYNPSPSVVLPDSFACDSPANIPGWIEQDCQYQPSYLDGIVAIVARRADDQSFGVFVLHHEEGNLVSIYEAIEPGAGTWGTVKVVVGDFNADDGAEVWVGYRSTGSGGYLDVDVLDPRPDHFFLGGLQGISHGQVDVHPGGATVVTAVYVGDDANCCPSQFLVQEISFAGATNDWRINNGTTYPAASTPPITSDF